MRESSLKIKAQLRKEEDLCYPTRIRLQSDFLCEILSIF